MKVIRSSLVIGIVGLTTVVSVKAQTYVSQNYPRSYSSHARGYYARPASRHYNRSYQTYRKPTHLGHHYYQTQRFNGNFVRQHTDPRYPYDKN